MEKTIVVTEDTVRRLAEALRGIDGKLDVLNKMIFAEMYEYLHELDDITDILGELLGVEPCEGGRQPVCDYVFGSISYEEMMAKIEADKATFAAIFGEGKGGNQ